jgi:hypothetical protein
MTGSDYYGTAGSPMQGLDLGGLRLGGSGPNGGLNIQPAIALALSDRALDLMGEILAKAVAFQSTQMQQCWFGGIGQGIGQQAIINRTQYIQALLTIIQIYNQLQKLLGHSATSLDSGDQHQQTDINYLIANGPLSSPGLST